MKKILWLFLAASSLITGCSNSESDLLVEEKVDFVQNDTESVLNELNSFATYSIKGAYQFYNPSLDYVDLDALDAYMLEYSFLSPIDTRAGFNGNVFINYEDYFKQNLSNEGYELIFNFMSKESLRMENFYELKKQIASLNQKDRELLAFVIEATEVLYANMEENLLNITETRGAPNQTACNILVSVTTSIAGSVWGAAFGGPIGFGVALAWSIAGAIAAQDRC